MKKHWKQGVAFGGAFGGIIGGGAIFAGCTQNPNDTDFYANYEDRFRCGYNYGYYSYILSGDLDRDSSREYES